MSRVGSTDCRPVPCLPLNCRLPALSSRPASGGLPAPNGSVLTDPHRDACQALDHELLPKNVEGTRAKVKRLVKLNILTEDDVGSLARKR
ncbi:hypothetical protein ACVWXU_004031 [Streptomyces sp. TE33382]